MNRNFVKTVFLLLICLVGIGFARGWFSVSSQSSNEGSHKVNINLTVDRDKVHEDAEALRKKTAELTDKAKDEAREIRDQINNKSQVSSK